MAAIRKTSPTNASAGRSVVARKPAAKRAVAKTAARSPRSEAVSARRATIAKTSKPIDDKAVADPADEEGVRLLAKARKPTKTAVAKTPANKTTANNKKTSATTLSEEQLAEDAAITSVATSDATRDAAPSPRHRGPSGVTRTAVDRLDDPPPESGLVLIERVLGTIEQEILRIECIVGRRGGKLSQRNEAERRARTLASLTKTLAELRRLRANEELQRPADDDAVPRDLDELRHALSQRLGQMVDDAAQPGAGEHE